jgi:hypothetical protein
LADENKNGALNFSSRKDLEDWLDTLPPEQGRWVAAAIAARAVLRGLPRLASMRQAGPTFAPYAPSFVLAAFLAGAFARAAARFPHLVERLPFSQTLNGTTVPLPKPIDQTLQSVLHAANGALAAVLRAAKIIRDDVARAAIVEAIFYCASDHNFYSALCDDVSFITSGGAPQALASEPLWPRGAPDEIMANWWILQTAIPREDDWQVWIDWYNRRLNGASDLVEIELVFATVPDKERAAGPAAANKWIKERLEELRKQDSRPPSPDPPPPPQPIENLPSPFTFGRNTAGQMTIVAGPQNTPVIAFPGDDATHRRWLETGRKLTGRLIADLQAGKFHNVRSDYREGLERYISDLPADPGTGNFLLADADARMLHSLFAAEPHILAEPFAARLKTVLENHFALLGFYPEVAR